MCTEKGMKSKFKGMRLVELPEQGSIARYCHTCMQHHLTSLLGHSKVTKVQKNVGFHNKLIQTDITQTKEAINVEHTLVLCFVI
jgi:hypothetical protein